MQVRDLLDQYEWGRRINSFILEVKNKFKIMSGRRRDKTDMKKYLNIKPRPFLAHLSLNIMSEIPSTNITNLNNLIVAGIECESFKDYEELNGVIEKYFNSSVNVYYRDYFIDHVNNTSVIVDPVKSWNDITGNILRLREKIRILTMGLYLNPDNYFFINLLTRVDVIVSRFMNNVYHIEQSE